MLGVNSSIGSGLVFRGSYRAFSGSTKVLSVFYSSFVKQNVVEPKQRRFEIVRREMYPTDDHLDSKKMSKSVVETFARAKELAKREHTAIEGPPPDTLESILAMKIRNKT